MRNQTYPAFHALKESKGIHQQEQNALKTKMSKSIRKTAIKTLERIRTTDAKVREINNNNLQQLRNKWSTMLNKT